MDLSFASLFFTLCKSLPPLKQTQKLSNLTILYCFDEKITMTYISGGSDWLKIYLWGQGLYFQNLSNDENLWQVCDLDPDLVNNAVRSMVSESRLYSGEFSTSDLVNLLLKIRSTS